MAEVPIRRRKSFKKETKQRKSQTSYAEQEIYFDRELLELQGLRKCSESDCEAINPLHATTCQVCEQVLKPL